ncbi:MAG: hypothetical protein ACI9LM_002101 [Alteromonadaceae bacterium]|jgi:hypothetical protein
MALPLLWLGAAAISALTVKGLSDDRKTQQKQRKHFYKPQTLADLSEHESVIATYPTDLFDTEALVKPVVGAIVCCAIGGILEHTGIWVDDDTIIEMDGQGLIKPISSRRFTAERSGGKIFIACDSNARPLFSDVAAQRALEQIFLCQHYDMINNNCHQFLWQCFNPHDTSLTTFKELNQRIAHHFDRKIYWDVCDC